MAEQGQTPVNPLGLVAGGGDLPLRVLEGCRRSGREVFVIALEGQARLAALDLCDVPHAWVRLGAAGKALRLLRGAGVRDVLLAGFVRRPSLAALRPDRWTAGFLLRSGAGALGDNGLLSALTAELENRQGFRIVDVASIVPDILAPSGSLGQVSPDPQAEADIARGLAVIRALGTADVGQAVVVQQGLVLAVEAIEGTGAMLTRVRPLSREGPGGVLVKAAKPGQERRTDLPTIGPGTVTAAAAAGLRGIAVEAGGALIVDREDTVAAADATGLFLVGVDAQAAEKTP